MIKEKIIITNRKNLLYELLIVESTLDSTKRGCFVEISMDVGPKFAFFFKLTIS